MKFRKLPVEIAVEGQVETAREIQTPEGFIEAAPDDVIVQGVHGERYPVKPEIFAKTYVPADPGDMDAFAFHDAVTPEGVQIIMEEEGGGGTIEVTGVHVAHDGLDREAWDRAVEFARELSAILDLSDPPLDDVDADGDNA